MTLTILSDIETRRAAVREALRQYYLFRQQGSEWTDTTQTPEQYRLSLETQLEEIDREIEAIH